MAEHVHPLVVRVARRLAPALATASLCACGGRTPLDLLSGGLVSGGDGEGGAATAPAPTADATSAVDSAAQDANADVVASEEAGSAAEAGPCTSGPPVPVPGPTRAGADQCATALHVAPGGSVKGTTCGLRSVGASPCQVGHPDAFVFVDAPPGTTLRLTASPAVSIMAFATCTSGWPAQCQFATSVMGPIAGYSLFAVERVDTCCGDFMLTVAAP